jgi:hypothetical protein
MGGTGARLGSLPSDHTRSAGIRQAARPLATACFAIACLVGGLGGIGVLINTVSTSELEQEFGGGPSGGERFLSFLVGGSAVAWAFLLFAGLGVLARSVEVVHGLIAANASGVREPRSEINQVHRWTEWAAAGYSISGFVAIGFGLVVGIIAGNAWGQIEVFETGERSFSGGAFLSVLIPSLVAALMNLTMGTTMAWQASNLGQLISNLDARDASSARLRR